MGLNVIQTVINRAATAVSGTLNQGSEGSQERAILVPKWYVQIPKPLIPEDIS